MSRSSVTGSPPGILSQNIDWREHSISLCHSAIYTKPLLPFGGKDFLYLGKSLSPTAKWLVALLTIALCVAAVLITIYTIIPNQPTSY